MKKEFKDLKVGDDVYTIKNGFDKVTCIENDSLYPIKTKQESFTLDGKCYTKDIYPVAFTYNPFEPQPENEIMQAPIGKLMEVSDKGERWYQRYVFMRKNELFIAWDHASSEKDVNATYLITLWKYAREIQPKITLSQSELLEIAAAAKGVTVDQIEIK